jgi:KUP system potassium uptake protein
MSHRPPGSEGHKETGPILWLSLAALGVVFGDLGTSPLYALQEAFHGTRGVAPSRDNVIGMVSLFLWALILVVSVKYVALLMRAGNRGEGGILALLALLTRGRGRRVGGAVVTLALLGAAMLYGDGIITPAISVLSAVEGLVVATPHFVPVVVPVTILILVLLFAVQPFGSGRVGVYFGPILATWFVAIAILGVRSLLTEPSVLAAFNPLNAVRFFGRNGTHGFLALGAVILCLTGGEALYADMGHFGRLPIRTAWYGLALPCLTLSYLGQAAHLLGDPRAASRPFYSTVPTPLLIPMVILATLATIVASQALISAVFSLTRQAAQLGFCPRVRIVHTSGATAGQVYLPGVNGLLMVATVAIVLGFRSSDRLAAAFGLAVSTTMAITTILFGMVARRHWHWSWPTIIVVCGGFALIDIAFVAANVVKFVDGGWLPLLIGAAMFVVMSTWSAGQRHLAEATKVQAVPLGVFLESLERNPPHRLRGTGVFLAREAEGVPLVLLHHLKHNQVLHDTVVLLTIKTAEVPVVVPELRASTEPLSMGFYRVTGRFGFMEDSNVPTVLRQAALAGVPIDPERTTYYLGRTTIIPHGRKQAGRMNELSLTLFGFLKRNDRSATLYFGIPPNRVVELGTRVEL